MALTDSMWAKCNIHSKSVQTLKQYEKSAENSPEVQNSVEYMVMEFEEAQGSLYKKRTELKDQGKLVQKNTGR